MQSYWTASPRLAKAAFVLGVLAVAHFAGLWLTYLFNPEPGSNPTPGVVLWGTVTGIPFVVIVALIASGFRSSSSSTIRLAATGATVMALGAGVILALVLTAPASAQMPATLYWLAGVGAVIGIAYAGVAFAGFRRTI